MLRTARRGLAATAVSIVLSVTAAHSATYWAMLDATDPFSPTQIANTYVTYGSLEDLSTDSNRLDTSFVFGEARATVATGSDGDTYWAMLDAADPFSPTQIANTYITYGSLEDLITDSNRLDTSFVFGEARATVATGSDGDTYWAMLDAADPFSPTQIANTYITYGSLQDLITDSNRLDTSFLFGEGRATIASGASILNSSGPVTPVPLPATLPMLLAAFGAVASGRFKHGLNNRLSS